MIREKERAECKLERDHIWRGDRAELKEKEKDVRCCEERALRRRRLQREDSYCRSS